MLMPLRQPTLARWFPDRLCPALAALLILIAAGLHLFYLANGCRLDLAPDEAHYWDWSRHLDWSYYSKGPLVAWLIRLSCELFGGLSERLTGNLMLAIRLPAVVCGSLLLVSLYVLICQVFNRPRLALTVVAVALTLPLVAVGSSLITIDSPYTCCWGWALVFAHRAITGRSSWAWEATGVVVGLGILAKYTMVLFLPSLALFLLTSREHRRLLFSPGFGSMVGLALVCCLPIVIWNAQHDWVTVLHVLRLAGLTPAGEAALRSGGGIRWMGPIKFLAVQTGLLLVYWFIVWLTAMIAYNPLRVQDPGLRYLWWLSAPMFLVFFAFSLKTGGGEPNWPVTAYISGGVLAAAWLSAQFDAEKTWYRRLGTTALVLTVLIGLALTLIIHKSHLIHPLLERLTGPPTDTRPFPVRRLDPTCRLRGWRHLAARIDQTRAELRSQGVKHVVLAGVSWSVPGELGVYCAGHPQAYNLGLVQGDRHSQYDFWSPNPIDQPERFLGKTFLIVGPISPQVMQGFKEVDPPILVTYEENGRPLAAWTLHVCRDFRGFPSLPARPH